MTEETIITAEQMAVGWMQATEEVCTLERKRKSDKRMHRIELAGYWASGFVTGLLFMIAMFL